VLTGHTAPPAPDPVAPAVLRVVDLRITGLDDWRGWFGVPPPLVVRVSIRNEGAEPAVDPAFSLLLGRPDRVETIVPTRPLGTIAAGDTRDLDLPVRLPAPAIGGYEIHGKIDTPAAPTVVFEAKVTIHPWGAATTAAVLLTLLLLRVSGAGRTGYPSSTHPPCRTNPPTSRLRPDRKV
jgi:hypothetical protein